MTAPATRPGPRQETPGTSGSVAPPSAAPASPTPASPTLATPYVSATASPAGLLPPAPPATPVALPAGSLAPVLSRIPVTAPVVFVGVDDGYVRDPAFVDLVRRERLPVTAFLTTDAWRADPDFWRRVQAAGVHLQNHTMTHPQLPTLSASGQQREICGASDAEAAAFGTRPTLLRAPYGATSESVRRVARACGIHAIVQWVAAVNDGVVQLQQGTRLQPGDIVLMHFRSVQMTDLRALLDKIKADGLTLGRLEDYLP